MDDHHAQALEITRTMQKAQKAMRTLFGDAWPHEVARWRELVRAHQTINPEETTAEAIVEIALQLEGAPYNLAAFLGAAFEIIQPQK